MIKKERFLQLIGSILILIIFFFFARAVIRVGRLQWVSVHEKGTFAGGYGWACQLDEAQKLYYEKHHSFYAGAIGDAPFSEELNKFGGAIFFVPSTITTTTVPSWTIVLTRKPPCPFWYGCYTITVTGPDIGPPKSDSRRINADFP